MKCKNCDCCKKGFVKTDPEHYACTGVKEPFVIYDVEQECRLKIHNKKSYGKMLDEIGSRELSTIYFMVEDGDASDITLKRMQKIIDEIYSNIKNKKIIDSIHNNQDHKVKKLKEENEILKSIIVEKDKEIFKLHEQLSNCF